ncbi:D-alanine--D-alanine ligase [bacterium SM23_31]|nr:MAG: D-alanine--D-alanine ligase [bacterium SM23_31]
MKTGKKRLGIIFGGRSSEHEVSIVSAKSILGVIDTSIYDVELIGITRQGGWLVGSDAKSLLEGKTITSRERLYIPATPREGRLALVTRQKDASFVRLLEKLDVVFPVLHGPYGEDGTIQGLLEMAGIPYVGAGVAASAVGMDKILMEDIFDANNLPTLESIHFTRKFWRKNRKTVFEVMQLRLGYPCFVKPANTGSSVGITKVHAQEGLEDAVDYAAEFDRKVLVQKGIDAREIECSVLGNDDPETSVPGEIVPSREFYDYNAKYVDGTSKLIIPAKLPKKTAKEIQELAVSAYKAIDCAGMARVDFFLERNTGYIYINEVNTIPGFTSISMYPKLWEVSGIPYPELVKKLIDLAFERFEDKANCKTTYTPPGK